MRKAYRAIKFFTYWLLKKPFPPSKIPRTLAREQKSKLKRSIDKFLGRIYRLVQFQKEKCRVWGFRFSSDIRQSKICLEIMRHSKKLIFFLILAFLGITCLDYGIDYLNNLIVQKSALRIPIDLPSEEFIELLLEIFIGAIAVVLGLIFALSSVGFQTATEKYSESVSSYINQEPVGEFFFRLLIFTEIYNIPFLAKLQFVSVFPYASIAISFALVALSLLGIVVFKDHYLVAIKPKSLFERMWKQFLDAIEIVSKRKSTFYKSWSIIQITQRKVHGLIGTIFDLYGDLVRDGKANEASIGLIVLGNILRDYMEKKRYIDTEYSWWFPERYELVRSSDIYMYPIKAAFEMEGRGVLHTPKPNYSWLEDEILDGLGRIRDEFDANTHEQLVHGIIEGYKTLLSGVTSKTRKAQGSMVKTGVYEEQEFQVFEKGLDQFLNLSQKLNMKNERNLTDCLNAYFFISHAILKGFEWEVLKTPLQELHSLKKETLVDLKLPTLFRERLIDYHGRLQVEMELEGRIVTPLDWLQQEVTHELAEEEKKAIDKFLEKLIVHSNTVIRRLFESKNALFLLHFMALQYNWVNSLIFHDKTDLAERCSQKIAPNGAYLISIGKEPLEKVEFLDRLEYGVFPSLIKNNQILCRNYFRVITATVMILCRGQKNHQILIERSRLLLIIGGLAYLVAEFKQDFSVLKEYARQLSLLDEVYGKKVRFLDFLSALEEYEPTHIIFRESTRYHGWFAEIFKQIDALAKIQETTTGMFPYDEVAEHPSPFIRELSVYGGYDQALCIRGFIEWLKRREQVKQLIRLLSQIRK